MPLYNPPGAASHPNLATHDGLGLATDAELTGHAADETAVHGIADAADLIVEGDARLTDARTPTAHAASHQDGGADELDVTGLVGAGAPSTADYLVGTAQAGLSAEIVVGATPGGELGGTWDSPTVDAGHSGSTHAAAQAAAEATAAAALTGHEAAGNPHPTYETGAEVLAQIGTHEGAADPHTGYQKESEKGAANGYASLGADTLVPQDQLGSGAQDGTKFLRDDGTWQTVDAAAPGVNAFTQDLGASRRSGTFDLTGLSGLTAEKVVTIVQSAAAIASKGDARDEPEMDLIQLTGYVVDPTTIRVYWQAPGVVVGTYAFAYQVAG